MDEQKYHNWSKVVLWPWP